MLLSESLLVGGLTNADCTDNTCGCSGNADCAGNCWCYNNTSCHNNSTCDGNTDGCDDNTTC